jgi:uncharacterized protein YfcZ (UPF0381/DUF406 family)
MTHEYYDPSEGIYQHYACAKNGKVLLCNDSDGEYEQVFGNREELHRFIEHLQEVADKAWPDPDLCVDIAETLERLQEINPEQYAWWYSKLYPTDNPPGDEWTSYTLATLRNLIRWKGYCEASLDLSNQDEVGEAGATAALDDLYANNDEGMKRLADS